MSSSLTRIIAAALVANCSLGCIGASGDDVAPDDLVGDPAAEALSPKETVSIDLGKTIGPATRRAAGFLYGVSARAPSDADVAPLGITFQRGDAAGPTPLAYDRLKAYGATFDRLLADDWNLTAYPDGTKYGAPWPGDGNAWGKWERFVVGQVRHAQSKHQHVNWEIWNEPDGGNFWGASHDQYLEMWRRAVVQIRAIEPSARIVGPSTSKFEAGFLRSFLAWTSAHGVLPDVICWHELSLDSPPNIKAHVAEAQQIAAPYYGGREVPIHINEYMDNNNQKTAHQYSPGRAVYFLANLERAQVEAAGHACWNEIGGGNNCFGETLSGLLTHDGKRQRRSTWWAYERYAAIRGELADVTPSANVDGLAGIAGDGVVRVLLGNHADGANVPVELHVVGLGATKVRMVVDAIHSSGAGASHGPVRLFEREATITAGTLTLELPGVAKKGAWSIVITPS